VICFGGVSHRDVVAAVDATIDARSPATWAHPRRVLR
jgi:hypothetical protein